MLETNKWYKNVEGGEFIYRTGDEGNKGFFLHEEFGWKYVKGLFCSNPSYYKELTPEDSKKLEKIISEKVQRTYKEGDVVRFLENEEATYQGNFAIDPNYTAWFVYEGAVVFLFTALKGFKEIIGKSSEPKQSEVQIFKFQSL